MKNIFKGSGVLAVCLAAMSVGVPTVASAEEAVVCTENYSVSWGDCLYTDFSCSDGSNKTIEQCSGKAPAIAAT